MRTIRIFISSPGDVAEERERARQVIDSLKRRYATAFQLKPVLWEDLPLQADMSFQHGIDLVLSDEHSIDIAVFILWSRIGSPLGPQFCKPDGSPYKSGTEREFDLMLRAREQSGGDRPAFLVYTRRDESSFEERLRGKPLTEKEDLISQKNLIERFIKEEFHDSGSGHNMRAYHTFDRPQTFSQRLRVHLIALLDAIAGNDGSEAIWDIETQGPPFMGLEAFSEKQSLVFCGRDSEILEARRALAYQAREGCSFLLLTGASGSGKSSLARAGVLPAIAEHELDETVAEWRTLAITPSELGFDPISGLVDRFSTADLLPELRAEGSTLGDVADLLNRDPISAVNRFIKRAIAETSLKRKGGVRLLLLIDQLEELFAMEKRDAFLAALDALARSGVCWIVATVRGDFLGEVQQSPTLVRLISGQGLFPVLAPDADALRRMIEEPATLAGLQFEEKDGRRLSDCILADAARHADLLPLVEYVLRELFDQRSPSGLLTWQSYETLGGVEGALARRADTVLASLSPMVQATLPTVLKRLVTLSEASGASEDGGERLIRQRVDLSSFSPDTPVRQLVDAFITERLLTAVSGEDRTASVTLAHEALLRVWPTASNWAEQNRDILRTRARVEARKEEGSPLLKGDPLLESARAFLITHADDFTAAQRTWIEDAIATAEAQERRAAKRRRLAFLTLSTLTLFAIAGAVWALKREQDAKKAETAARESERVAEDRRITAEASEQKAKRAKATAEGLINSMLYDLRDKLTPLNQLNLLDDVSRQAESYFKENPPETSSAEREMSTMWTNRGDVAAASGNFTAARKYYQQAIEIHEGHAKTNPNNSVAQRDWGTCLNRLGGVELADGNYAAARNAYQQSLAIAERLAQTVPNKELIERDKSISIECLGDIANAEGDRAAARKAYQQANEIRERLAMADPNNAEAQRDWSISLRNLGDVAIKEGDFVTARIVCQKALEISERLAKADPSNAVAQRDWSFSLESLGIIKKADGDYAAAHAAFQQCLEIRERIAKEDPKNLSLQHLWCVTIEHLADVTSIEGDRPTAWVLYQQAIEIHESLVKNAPDNDYSQRNLSILLDKIGDFLTADRQLSAAEQTYRKALEICERRAKANPNDSKAQKEWSMSHIKCGDIAATRGDLAAARESFLHAIEIRERLAKAQPSNAIAQHSWSIALDKLGEVAKAMGQLADARQAYQQSLVIRQGLIKTDPSNSMNQRDVGVSLEKMGDVATAEGNFVAARQAYQQSLEIREKLAKLDPNNGKAHRDWSVSLEKLGNIATTEGNLAAARIAYQQSLEIREKLAKLDPNNDQAHRDLSISLNYLGNISIAEGDLVTAKKHYQQSLEIRFKLAQSNPTNAEAQRSWSVGIEQYASVTKAEGNLAATRQSYQQSIEIRERLAKASPDHAESQRDWSISISSLGDVLIAEGNLSAARKIYQQSTDIIERLAKANPQNAECQRDLFVTFCKVADLLDKQKNADAIDWWKKAHQQLTSMKERGVLEPADEKFLEITARKIK